MKTKRLNGILFEGMLLNGLASLRIKEKEVNSLNVFPVADGDTGTNMCMTLENGLRTAKRSQELCTYLKGLSKGMLFGARGNSGVILSQFFNGIYLELSRCAAASVGDFRNALIRAYKTAYSAVVKPVEGTILTVTREGIENIRKQIDRSSTIETVLSMYIAEMKKSLAYTPELLPVLKEANVVDSGAMGFIIIAEGMLKFLYGEVLSKSNGVDVPESSAPKAVNLDFFNENSAFEKGYCMEFILQLMTDKKYNQRFRLDAFIQDLSLYGESLVVTQDEKRVKVHIHTFYPAKVITASQEFGEFLQFKLENMQLQHNEYIKEKKKKLPKKFLSVVAVVSGDGVEQLYRDLGCDVIIQGGDTMNTSSEEFLNAFDMLESENIVVLPNNKNIIWAAEQAVKLSGKDNITVIPTNNILEGYYALSMDIAFSTDLKERLALMKQGASEVTGLFVANAVRDYEQDGVSCKRGQTIVLYNDRLCVSDDNINDAVCKAISKINEDVEAESIMLLRGADVTDDEQALLEEALGREFSDLEIVFSTGNQPVYPWIVSLF